jgi:hypothetical protein
MKIHSTKYRWKADIRLISSHFCFYPIFFWTFHYRLYSRRHGHPRLSEDGGLSNLQQRTCSYRSTTIRMFTKTPASISVHSVRGSTGVSVEWLGGKRGRLSRAVRHITASARRVNGCCRNDPAVQEGGLKWTEFSWSRFIHFMSTDPPLGRGGGAAAAAAT